ncbi:MAG: 30S ribosomal protein S5, partial [Bdellovibrio sp.]
IKDILTKCVGTRNPNNAVRATMDGLRQLVDKKINEM